MGVLSQLQSDRAIQRFLAAEDENADEATRALDALRRRPGEAVAGLVAQLRRGDRRTYRRAAIGLYRLLDGASVECFCEALATDDARVLAALSKILRTSRRYDPNRLIPLFLDDRVHKATLIRILSEQRGRVDPQRLLRYAARLDRTEHPAVFRVLAAIADESLVPELVNRATAADPSLRVHVVRVLARFRSATAARSLHARLGDDNKLVRLAALEGLAECGARPRIGALVALLRDPDLTVQSRAIDALIELGHPDTMRHLLPVLQDESEYVRRAGVEVLNAIADRDVINDLLMVLRDKDWWVRERAADALARIGGPRVISAVIELIHSADELVRRTAIEVVNASRDPRAHDHLIEALGDEDWWVKERAIDALAALGSRAAIPHLLRELDNDPRARATILRALAALGEASVLPRVLDALADPDRHVRLEALRTLESLTEADSAAEVIARIERSLPAVGDTLTDRARVVIGNIRARFGEAADTGGDAVPAAETATRIAHPGEPVRHLGPGTKLDLTTLAPGTVLDDRYRYVETLGSGGFGKALRFEDTKVGEEIVLKFLNESLTMRERVSSRFVRELRYARRVTHPNVIRLYDFLRIGGLYAISMEYFAGFPLARELLDRRPMRTDRALRLLREITFGMAAAHGSGVIHRDLKPGNILMSHGDQVKIVDFGIAAAAARDEEDTGVTRAGELVGTPSYIAPEQIEGRGVDARSDIYSLGIVMYRMLSGRLPYQAADRRGVLAGHLEGRARPLAEHNPRLPRGLADAVARAMARDPAARPASMTDLRRELEQFMGH